MSRSAAVPSDAAPYERVSSVYALMQAHFLLPPEPGRYRIHTEQLSYEHKCGDEGPHYIDCPSRSLSLNYCEHTFKFVKCALKSRETVVRSSLLWRHRVRGWE